MKTNEEAKQEAIRRAYFNKWEFVKDFCDDEGWITNKWIAHGVSKGVSYEDAGYESKDVQFKQYNSSDNSWRLKYLSAIDTNNGWTRIEPDGSNLPSQDTNTKCISSGRVYNAYYEAEYKKFNTDLDIHGEYLVLSFLEVTHYKPIKEEPKYIY